MLLTFALTALIVTTALAGVHLTGPAIITPLLRSLDAAEYVRRKQLTDAAAPKLAKPLMLGSLGVTALAVAVAVIVGETAAAALFALALAALIVTLVAILRGDLPINRQMAGWRPESPPPDWQEVRSRWERIFSWRVAANLVAVVFTAAGILVAG